MEALGGGVAVLTAETVRREQLGAIEEALAGHRAFGDSGYIHGQLRLCLTRRLRRIAPHLPVAARLLDALEPQPDTHALHRLTGDLVFRSAVLHAHTQIEAGAPCGLSMDDCEAIFAATARHLEEGRADTPLQDGTLLPLGSDPYLGWVWSDAHSDDVYGRCYRHLVGDHYGALPVTPSERELATLADGVRLLQHLLPSITPSVLSHAHVVACVPDAGTWKGMASGSNFQLGGTVFLGRQLPNAWWVAEHLLHEAAHQKLYDFRHGHSLLALGIARGEGPRVWSPWNPYRLDRANHWDTNRVLAAFHVYVHVALLAIVAEARAAELEDTFGPMQSMTSSRTALDRAWYLGHRLKEQCRAQLGLAGERMVDWLLAVMELLDPAPPPAGAYLHFALDVYTREGRQTAAVLQNQGAASALLARTLRPLAQREVGEAQALLSALSASHASDSLKAAVDGYADDELGANFADVRGHIATAILAASPDGFRLDESGRCDGTLQEFLETAGASLYAVLEGIPPTVAEARRRASELSFVMSCRDDVGRLLQVLAAAVPPGGRILEIGTGAGVGTAWLVSGLGRRTDVEVVTVDIEPALSEATRTGSSWPDFVQFVNADAAQVIGSLGAFSLVFADAAPVKYGGIEAVVAALRPGGLVVVDDFKTSMRTSDSRRADIERMRQTLLQHPELHTVELEWSSGVVLASRVHHG